MDSEKPEEQFDQNPLEETNEAPEEQQTPEVDSTRDGAGTAQEAGIDEATAAEMESESAAMTPEPETLPAQAQDEAGVGPSAGKAEAEVPAEETEADQRVPAEAEETESAPVSGPKAGQPAEGEQVPPEASSEPAWYVIHCYSGYENKVRHSLEQRIETMGMKDKIFDVVIPTQEEIEVREGKRRTVERHIFPGYVLVNLILTEESWYVVRNTPGVTGFVGMGNLPTPLRPEEVSQIIKRMEAEAPTVKVTFKVGERVRIIDGPFNDFRGTVAEIDMERTKVRVMVSFFGRETPVELDFLQVEKA